MNRSMKKQDLIRKTVRTVVLGNNVQLASIGAMANNLVNHQMIRTDETNIPDLVKTLTDASQIGNTIVALQNEAIADLCKALNRNLTHGKLIIVQNGQTDDNEFLNEIASMTLHTTEGSTEFFPEATKHPDMFQDDGRVLLRSSKRTDKDGDALFRADDTYWGKLLPEQMRYEDYVGTLSEVCDDLSEDEQDAIICRIGTEEMFAEPNSILIFRTHKELFAVPLPDAKQIPAQDLQLYLLTGLTPDAGTVTLMQVLFTCGDLRQGIALAEHYCTNIF